MNNKWTKVFIDDKVYLQIDGIDKLVYLCKQEDFEKGMENLKKLINL